MKACSLLIIFTTCAILAASCGNNRSAGTQGSGINGEKIELAENILASLDSLEQICDGNGNGFDDILDRITSTIIGDRRLVKPDYLLDPSDVRNLLSNRQKVNALAILLTERPIRKAYGMPVREVDEAIARLCIEVGHPVSIGKDLSFSEITGITYQACKENDELCYFWLFDSAVQNNLLYLISFNSGTFFSNITPEQYRIFVTRLFAISKAARKIAEYDSEMAIAIAMHEKNWEFQDIEEAEAALSTIEDGKAMIARRQKDYIGYRNWALQ